MLNFVLKKLQNGQDCHWSCFTLHSVNGRLEAAMQRLTNLCSVLNDMEPICVLNHVFVLREVSHALFFTVACMISNWILCILWFLGLHVLLQFFWIFSSWVHIHPFSPSYHLLPKRVAILSLSTLSLLLVIMYPEYIDFHLFGISVNPLGFFSILFVHAQIALLM